MGKNRNLPSNAMWRWDQYNTRWVKFTGSVDEQGITQVKITDGTSDASIDGSTATLQTIEYEHHEIHAGTHYFVAGYESEDNGGTVEFVFTTPDTDEEQHLTFEVVGTQNTTLDVYKGSTSIEGGSSVTPINNNGRSSNTSNVTVLKDPASITDGNLIFSQSSGANKSVGIIARDREVVLDRDSTYLFRLTSGGNSNIINWNAEWYEHTPKN